MKIKNKIWIFVMILLVLIISGCNPTGRAVQDTEEDLEEVGTYAIRPSFETEINYDFSDYEKIKQAIDFLQEECINEGDIKKCIESKTGQLNSMTNMLWGIGSCERGEKAFFYSFVKAYEDCFFSLDDDCVCKGEPYNGDDLTGEIKLSFSGTGALILTLGIFERELPGKLSYVTNGYVLDPQALDWTFKISKGNIDESNILPEHGIYDKKVFPLYKNNSVVSLITKKPGLEIDKKKECETTQDHFQLCLLNTYRKYPKIVDGKFQEESLLYKFSVIFEDTVAPPLIDLTTKDTAKKERSVNLTWKKSEAKDTNHYRVYFSDEMFDKITKAKNILNVTSENETIEVNISVEADDKPYYFAVTAVDNTGNKLEGVEAKVGVSLDDLGPKKPNVELRTEGTKKILGITLPLLNEDDSVIQEDEITLFVRGMPKELTCLDTKKIVEEVAEESTKLKGKPGDKIEIDSYGAGCYAFTAKDKKGNIKLDEDDTKLEELIEVILIP